MIVADANVLAYLFISGDMTATAQRLRERDPEWAVPPVWRWEFGNVLVNHHRTGRLTAEACEELSAAALERLTPNERDVRQGVVLSTAIRTRCTMYDAAYVALAQQLGVALVTEDQALLRAVPEVAVSMERFLARGRR